jgi:hypothetical protein
VVEIPVPVLVLPTLAFLLSSWHRKRPEETGSLVSLFAAVLPLPVVVTTASALEPQAVVVAYMLGAALLVQSLLVMKSFVPVPNDGQEKVSASSLASAPVPLTTGSGLEGS